MQIGRRWRWRGPLILLHTLWHGIIAAAEEVLTTAIGHHIARPSPRTPCMLVIKVVTSTRGKRVGSMWWWCMAIWGGVGHYLLARAVRGVSTDMALGVAAGLWSTAATIILRGVPPAIVRILGWLQAGSWVRMVEPTVLGVMTWGGGTSNSSP